MSNEKFADFELIRGRQSRRPKEGGTLFEASSHLGRSYVLLVNPTPLYGRFAKGSALVYFYEGVFGAEHDVSLLDVSVANLAGPPRLVPHRMWTMGYFRPLDSQPPVKPEILDQHPMYSGYRVFDEFGNEVGRTHDDDGNEINEGLAPIARLLYLTLVGAVGVVRDIHQSSA